MISIKLTQDLDLLIPSQNLIIDQVMSKNLIIIFKILIMYFLITNKYKSHKLILISNKILPTMILSSRILMILEILDNLNPLINKNQDKIILTSKTLTKSNL